MPNPFLVSQIEFLSMMALLEKADEYEKLIELVSRYRNSTSVLVIQYVRAALVEILAEIERRGKSNG